MLRRTPLNASINGTTAGQGRRSVAGRGLVWNGKAGGAGLGVARSGSARRGKAGGDGLGKAGHGEV